MQFTVSCCKLLMSVPPNMFFQWLKQKVKFAQSRTPMGRVGQTRRQMPVDLPNMVNGNRHCTATSVQTSWLGFETRSTAQAGTLKPNILTTSLKGNSHGEDFSLDRNTVARHAISGLLPVFVSSTVLLFLGDRKSVRSVSSQRLLNA